MEILRKCKYHMIIGIIIIWLLSKVELNKNKYQSKTQDNVYNVLRIYEFSPKQFHYEVVTSGILKAHKYQKVVFDIDRNVEQVLVNNGERVNKGQVIALIGSKTERQAALRIFNKSRLLLQKHTGKLHHTSKLQGAIDSLNFALTQNKAISHLINQLVVTAKFHGTVTNMILETNHPTPINKVALEIVDDSILIAKLKVSEAYLNNIDPQATVSILSHNNPVITGKIRAIDNTINSNSGTFLVDIHIPNKQQYLKHGMEVQAIVKTQPVTAYLVPNMAIIKNNNDEYVIKLVDKNYVINEYKVKILKKDIQHNKTWISFIDALNPKLTKINIITFGAQFFQDQEQLDQNRIMQNQ